MRVVLWRLLVNGLLLSQLAGCVSSPGAQSEEEQLRVTERQRLRALVEANIDVARRLHADDFQLVTPDGSKFTKQEYLDAIESGDLDYTAWDPGPIVVRLYGKVAVIRYEDQRFTLAWKGVSIRGGKVMHTDLYEKRNGLWQAVWSQASGVLEQDK